MVRVTRIGLFSFAKIYTTLSAIFGLFVGTLSAIMQSVSPAPPLAAGPMMFGWFSIIIFPLLYAVIGFILSVVGVALYNWLASSFGGVEIELEKESRK